MSPRERSRSRGFSIVELMVALAVMSVGILGLAGTLGSSIRLGDDRRDEIRRSIHLQNARNTVANIDFADIPALLGPGSGNEQFWCDVLGTVLFNDPGDAVSTGTIEIFLDEATVPAGFGGTAPGMDLNANGVIDPLPVADLRILPVRITVTTIGNPDTPELVGQYLLRP